MKISFSIRLPFFKIIYWFVFGILVIGICLLFEICYLEFPLAQLLHEWIRKSLATKCKKITNKGLIGFIIGKILFRHFALKKVICPNLIADDKRDKNYNDNQHNFQGQRA